MKIPEYEDWIKSSHPMGWKGVLNGYPIKDIPKTKAFVIASILSIFIYIISLFSSKTYGCQLIDLAEINVSVFPNLLGFNLGGYAIIVGFSSLELIKSMMKPQKTKKHSLFQETSSIFAFSIVLQAIVLVSSFLIKVIDLIDLKNYLNLFDFFFKSFNVLSIFIYPILLFITIYALVLLPFIIINVFTFGQMNHAYLNIQQLNELKNKDNDAN